MFLQEECVETKSVIAKLKTVSLHWTLCLSLTWVTAYGGRGRRQLQATAYSLCTLSKCTHQVTNSLTDKQLTISVKSERIPDYHFQKNQETIPKLEVFLLIQANWKIDLPLPATFLTSNIYYDLFVGKFMDELLTNLSVRHLNCCTIQPIFPLKHTANWSNNRFILTWSCFHHCCSYRCLC